MIDLTAPIFPGISAAGILLGSSIDSLIANHGLVEIDHVGHPVIYMLPSIKIWAVDRRITQVGVSSAYLGKIYNEIGIGSSIREVEELFDRTVVEDEEDNLRVETMHGWSFETTEWVGDHTVADNRDARITQIFVHA